MIFFSPNARLKVLDLTLSLYHPGLVTIPVPLPHGGLCEELEAMAGHNMLEALSFDVFASVGDTVDSIGSMFQKVEKVLVKSGWSALRQVSFKVTISCPVNSAKLSEELQSLPDKYLSHLPKLESVTFNYSSHVTRN
jgi:hypothetical protein